MSTIPSTTSSRTLGYAVQEGAAPPQDAPPVSAIVLNRGGRQFNRGIFDDLERCGFPSIMAADVKDEALDVESIQARHPRARFLLLKEPLGTGELVNAALKEAWGEFALVIANDMEPDFPPVNAAFVERLKALDALCVVPLPRGPEGAPLPGIVAPAMDRTGSLKFLRLEPGADGERSLFPADYCGFYSRSRFLISGGYDPTIANPWWQKADFGFRAYLWGERIKCSTEERVVHRAMPREGEDASADESYRRFFLKNLAVKKRGDEGILPIAAFAPWLLASKIGLGRAIREFREAREWVNLNRFRFINDAAGVVDMWGT